MQIETKRFDVTECTVQDANAKKVNQKAKQLEEEGFACGNIHTGYETSEEESRVYWFKAVKKVSID